MPIQPKQQPPYYTPSTVIQEYIAIITQTSTNNPEVLIIKNTIGDIVWTREAEGYYIGTLADTFTINKTAVFNGQSSDNYNINTLQLIANYDKDYVEINNTIIANNNPVDGFNNVSIHIITKQ